MSIYGGSFHFSKQAASLGAPIVLFAISSRCARKKGPHSPSLLTSLNHRFYLCNCSFWKECRAYWVNSKGLQLIIIRFHQVSRYLVVWLIFGTHMLFQDFHNYYCHLILAFVSLVHMSLETSEQGFSLDWINSLRELCGWISVNPHHTQTAGNWNPLPLLLNKDRYARFVWSILCQKSYQRSYF